MICEDHLASGESFAIVRCDTCGLLFTNPRPSEEELGKYYDSNAYISHTDKANSFINLIYKLVRSYTLQQKVKLINSLSEEKILWDYGCGTGDFLLAAKNRGWRVYGLEPNVNARQSAQEKVPGAIIKEADTPPEKIHVITAWHVIEHISQLQKVLKEIVKSLAPGGYLVMAVPNHKSYDAQRYKEYWAAYDVPRHLYHFDRNSVKTLAEKNGLQLERTIPMKFDSFYVSMLSEKNQGTNNIVRAFYNGWVSNKKAKQTGEYSSLIYLFKR